MLSGPLSSSTLGFDAVAAPALPIREAAATEIGNLAEAVRALRDESGLTWDQLGKLFGVTRRALHLWATGGRINAAHTEVLGAVLQVVRQLPAQDAASRRELLLAPGPDGRSLYDRLRDRHSPNENISGSPFAPDQLLGARHDGSE
ncbi:hypothetical protein GCM10027612_01730 [Microbispora bryophytorum subsp. camponoti]